MVAMQYVCLHFSLIMITNGLLELGIWNFVLYSCIINIPKIVNEILFINQHNYEYKNGEVFWSYIHQNLCTQNLHLILSSKEHTTTTTTTTTITTNNNNNNNNMYN
jgi:hypothetical protein